MIVMILSTFSYANQFEKPSKKTFINEVNSGVSTVYDDTKNGVSTLYSDVKSIAPDAKLAIKEIYGQIKKVSSYTWNLLVKQQYVWSWCYLIGNLMFLLSTYRFWLSYKIFKDDKNESGDIKEVNSIPLFIYGALSIILGYFSFIHFEAMMTGFLNPEFGALRNLLEISKTLK